MKSKPRPIRDLLEHSATVGALMRDLRQQQQLLATVRALLPANQASHCLDARLHRGVLTLFADSPVWTNKLRFTTPRLLSEVRRAHPGVASIAVRTFPRRQFQGPKRHRRKAVPSKRAAALVEDGALAVVSPSLRSALMRLARTLKRD